MSIVVLTASMSDGRGTQTSWGFLLKLNELFEHVMMTGEQIKRENRAFIDRVYGPLVRSFIREQKTEQAQCSGGPVQEGRAQEHEIRQPDDPSTRREAPRERGKAA